MTEFELKLQLPPGRAQESVRALTRGKATRQLLQAHYFDTADGALAAVGASLRLRKEGRRWVQTAKAAGDSALHRLEHNVAVRAAAPADAVPPVDWRLHAGTPVGHVLEKALSARRDDNLTRLKVVYRTRVQRLKRVIASQRSAIEVALDRGWVEANGERAPIGEIEFELKKGMPHDAIAFARRWHAAHGGWLSTLSKAERGLRLARKASAPACEARDPASHARSGDEFGRAVLHACLEQILANASEIAAGSTDAEHVHQLRVGVRRLRTAVRELAGILPAVDAQWEAPWLRLFRELGRHRDQRSVAQLQSRFEAAGGPALQVPPDALGAADPVAAVRSPAWQDALLAMLGWMHEPAAGRKLTARQVKALVARRLRKLHVRVLKEGRCFERLPAQRQHRVRKRLKRLRYLSELARHLFDAQQVTAFVEALKPAQDALGEYNDELLASAHFAQWAGQEPRAWFGAGWLTARRAGNAAACAKALRALADVRPFWK